MNNNSNEDDELFFKERGFGKSLGLKGNLCFIVIDLIKGFTDPNMPLGVKSTEQIENVNKFLDVCRLKNIPVVFTVIVYEDLALSDAGIWFQKAEGLKTLMAGTTAVELDERLHFQKGDTVLTKKYASAFFGSDLNSRLKSNHIDTLIIAGSSTSGCVRATAVDAIQLGYRPIVLSDCVGDRSKASHEQSLFDMHQKYADVLTSQEAIDSIMDRDDRKRA